MLPIQISWVDDLLLYRHAEGFASQARKEFAIFTAHNTPRLPPKVGMTVTLTRNRKQWLSIFFL